VTSCARNRVAAKTFRSVANVEMADHKMKSVAGKKVVGADQEIVRSLAQRNDKKRVIPWTSANFGSNENRCKSESYTRGTSAKSAGIRIRLTLRVFHGDWA